MLPKSAQVVASTLSAEELLEKAAESELVVAQELVEKAAESELVVSMLREMPLQPAATGLSEWPSPSSRAQELL